MGVASSTRRAVSAAVVAALVLLTAVVAVSGSPAQGRSGAARAFPDPAVDSLVHLNQIQTIGSHNSYKEVASPEERSLRESFIGSAEQQLDYNHVPLPEQFASQKVRQIELDTYIDRQGGLYANPLLRQVLQEGPYDPALDQPGFKVLHIQDVDYRSTCVTLVRCLQAVKGWSDANPEHVPIAILLELKDTPLTLGSFDFVDPTPYDAQAMDELDAEIRSVFAPGDLITPDDVRGSHPTLEEGVLADGWPTLAQSRGKVLFLMDNDGSYRDLYRQGHPNLEGRAVFTNSNPGQPDAAFVKRNDAKGSFADIQDLVAKGYIVRTRADSDTAEARVDDTSTRDAALASGAQWVSTDYPVPDYGVGFQTSYVASIPGGYVARCNPVNGPEGCDSAVLDTIYAPPTSTTTTTTVAPASSSTSTTTGSTGSGAVPVGAVASFTG